MNSIYEYENYRLYLKDFFNFQKRNKRFFSQRYFAQRAGFASHSFCAFVIKGERNLSKKSLSKMIQGIGLEGNKARYFEKMVRFNQAKSEKEKISLFKELNTIRRRSKFFILNRKYYKYFDNWYMPVIRHLAVYSSWNNDYTRLGSMLLPPISEDKARKAVDTLLKMGLLIKNSSDDFAHNSSLINTDNVPAVIRKKARRDLLQKGMRAADKMGPKDRYISYSTLSMSEKTYKDITRYLESVKKEIYNRVIEDKNTERVYQMAFELFPVSSRFIKSGNGDYNDA